MACPCACHGLTEKPPELCDDCAVEDQRLLAHFLKREEQAREIMREAIASDQDNDVMFGNLSSDLLDRMDAWLKGD